MKKETNDLYTLENFMKEKILYARKLYEQELGYRKGKPKKAGRYFYISKQAISYFPPLSSRIRNDSVLVNVIPPGSGSTVLTHYIYHNDKIVDQKPGGRDEFRLYLNSGNDPDRDFFKPGDIVVLEKYQETGELIYRMHYFPVSEKGDMYDQIDRMIEESNIPRGHALIPANKLPFIELEYYPPWKEKVVPPEVAEVELKQPVEETLKSIELQPLPIEVMAQEFKFTSVIREHAFRDLLLYFYDNKCAITGSFIKYGNLINLEAAHIIPDLYGGPSHPKNGIPLSRDLHWAFDQGFFTVNPDYIVQAHENVLNVPLLKQIHEKKMFLPRDERAWPSPYSLKWHMKNVFGIFSQKAE